MIKKYSLKALQQALNHGLSLDETRSDKIRQLHGKVLEIIINPLKVSFYITFDNAKLVLLDEYAGKIDTHIESSPIGLIRLSLLPASKVRSLFNDKIKISGDIALGQELKQLFDELDIDWEGHLAHFTGDVVANQIGNIFKEGQLFKNKLTSSIKRNLTEYLQEEAKEFPSREEIRDFFNDIDDLSMRTERASAHINKILVEHGLN